MNSDAPPKEGQKAQRGAFRGAFRGFEGRPSKEGQVGQYENNRDIKFSLTGIVPGIKENSAFLGHFAMLL